MGGVLLPGEHLGTGQAAGMVLVLAAIAIGGLTERKANFQTNQA